MPEKTFNVVFQGTGAEHSNYEGIRTWTSFKSRRQFYRWQKTSKNGDIIVAVGVSEDEAKRLVALTGGRVRALSAIKEGNGDEELLKAALRNAAYACRKEGTLREFVDALFESKGLTELDFAMALLHEVIAADAALNQD